jgi:hypothetical protein
LAHQPPSLPLQPPTNKINPPTQQLDPKAALAVDAVAGSDGGSADGTPKFRVPVDSEHKSKVLKPWSFVGVHHMAFSLSWLAFFAAFTSTFGEWLGDFSPYLKKFFFPVRVSPDEKKE